MVPTHFQKGTKIMWSVWTMHDIVLEIKSSSSSSYLDKMASYQPETFAHFAFKSQPPEPSSLSVLFLCFSLFPFSYWIHTQEARTHENPWSQQFLYESHFASENPQNLKGILVRCTLFHGRRKSTFKLVPLTPKRQVCFRLTFSRPCIYWFNSNTSRIEKG